MELNVREAAALLGRSRRTVRAQLVRGELDGTKRDGAWRLDDRRLPLTEAQREALQRKADRVRRVVEDALPSRMAGRRGQRSRSIADLEAFRRGAAVLAEMREDPDGLDEAIRERAAAMMEEAILALAEGIALFDRRLKLEALNRARAKFARCAAVLFLAGGIPPAEPVFGWVTAIESEVIPAVAGLARWAEEGEGSAVSWRDAPLYVEAFDLSVWVAERAGGWPNAAVGRLATETSVELVSSVSLALTFPDTRQRHLAAADEGVVRLRTVLRVAESLSLLSKGGLRYAAARLAAIGRMLGGWRKRLRRRPAVVAGGEM